MKENKMEELLKGLSPSEFKRLGEFVRSPYHNKSGKVVKLYDYINSSSDFRHASVSFEDINKAVYNEKPNISNVRALISDFSKLIEKFLTLTEWEKNKAYQKTLLLTALNDRSLSKNFHRTFKETIEEQKAEFNRDEDFYYNSIFLEVESFNYGLERDSFIAPEDFQKISSSIDLFFIITKLNLLHFMYYHKQNIAGDDDYGIWLKNEIIDNIEKNISAIKKEHPVIYMKYLILKTITEPENYSHFTALKKFLLKNIDKMNRDVRAYIFGALTNYCIVRCNSGDTKFKIERYKIYELMEKSGMFITDKYINYIDFLKLIFAALEVGRITRAEQFFLEYRNLIIPELKRDTLYLAHAQIHYYKKKYESAIRALNNVSYYNAFFYLRAKVLLTRIYYELKEVEPIDYIIDTAKHYVKRKSKSTALSGEMYNKYFLYLKKLINLDGNDKEKIDNVKFLILKDKNVMGKEWLLNKIGELENT
jgi:hypothetical protein